MEKHSSDFLRSDVSSVRFVIQRSRVATANNGLGVLKISVYADFKLRSFFVEKTPTKALVTPPSVAAKARSREKVKERLPDVGNII